MTRVERHKILKSMKMIISCILGSADELSRFKMLCVDEKSGNSFVFAYPDCFSKKILNNFMGRRLNAVAACYMLHILRVIF